MSSRRTLIVIVAVVIGAIAAFSLSRYVGGVEDSAYGKARRVEVLVVKQDIPREFSGNDAVQQGYIGTALIPQEFRPATALADTSGLEALVAKTDLVVGQVVVDGVFVPLAEAISSTSERIEDGLVAVTISVDQVRGVAGLVAPGDRVNMIIDDPATVDPLNPENDAAKAKTFLYQNVRVFAIGAQLTPALGETVSTDPAAAAPPAESTASNLMTLMVPPEAALKIAYVGSENVYLALVPPENEPVDIEPATKDNLLTGPLTPYADEEL